jgi:hypothetical protein
MSGPGYPVNRGTQKDSDGPPKNRCAAQPWLTHAPGAHPSLAARRPCGKVKFALRLHVNRRQYEIPL